MDISVETLFFKKEGVIYEFLENGESQYLTLLPERINDIYILHIFPYFILRNCLPHSISLIITESKRIVKVLYIIIILYY